MEEIFFNNHFEYKVHEIKRDDGGNLTVLDITKEDNRVTLMNIYVPNSDSLELNEYVRESFWNLTMNIISLRESFTLH